MRGDEGDDTIDGAYGNDAMGGFDGFDTLKGGQGNDFISIQVHLILLLQTATQTQSFAGQAMTKFG